MNKLKFSIILLFIITIIVGCKKQKTIPTIENRVFIFNEFGSYLLADLLSPEGVSITFENTEYTEITDATGYCEFIEIEPGEYNIIYEKEGIGKYILYNYKAELNDFVVNWSIKTAYLTEHSTATITNLQIDTFHYAGDVLSRELINGMYRYRVIGYKIYVYISGNVSQPGDDLTSFFIYIGNQDVSSENYITIIKPTLELNYTNNLEYDDSGNFTYQDTISLSLYDYSDVLYAIAYAVPGKYFYEKKISFDTYINPNTNDTIYPGLGQPSNKAYSENSLSTEF